MKGNMINYSMKDMQKLSFKGAIQLSILNSDALFTPIKQQINPQTGI